MAQRRCPQLEPATHWHPLAPTGKAPASRAGTAAPTASDHCLACHWPQPGPFRRYLYWEFCEHAVSGSITTSTSVRLRACLHASCACCCSCHDMVQGGHCGTRRDPCAQHSLRLMECFANDSSRISESPSHSDPPSKTAKRHISTRNTLCGVARGSRPAMVFGP